MNDINKVAQAVNANNKLLQELLVSLSGGRASQKPYKTRTSRGPGAEGGDGDIATDIESAQKELIRLKNGIREFNKGLIEGVPLGKIFVKLTERIEDTIEADSKFAKETIESAKKLAKSVGVASDSFLKAADDVSKLQDLIDQINKLNIIALTIQQKNNDITDLQNKASMIKLQLTNKMSAEERKTLKNELKSLEKTIKVSKEHVVQMQKVIDTNTHLVDEFKHLILNSEGVSETFKNLDDVTRKTILNIDAKNTLDDEQLQAISTVNKELNTFSQALKAISDQAIKSREEFNQSLRDFGSTISNEIVGFVKNQGMGVVDRYVAQRGAGFSESNYSQAISLGLDERDITRLGSQYGMAARAFGGSMDRSAAFSATSADQTARGIMTPTQQAIRDIGIAFGVTGAEAAERAMQIAEAAISTGMQTDAEAVNKTSDMFMGLARIVGSTSQEMSKLWEISAQSGQLAMMRMTHEGKTEEEKDKLVRNDFAMRVKSLRVMGLQNEQIERSLSKSGNSLFSGFRDRIMADVAGNMAIDMFGKTLRVGDTTVDLTSQSNSGLRDRVMRYRKYGDAALVGMSQDQINEIIQVEEALSRSANQQRIEAAAIGDTSTIDRISLGTEIVQQISPNALDPATQEVAASYNRMRAAGQTVEGATDNEQEFTKRMFDTVEATKQATSALVPFAEQMMNIANVAKGIGLNPVAGAAGGIGSSAIELLFNGLALYGGAKGAGSLGRRFGGVGGMLKSAGGFLGRHRYATALTAAAGYFGYSNLSEVDPETGQPAMSTGEAVARTGTDLALQHGIGSVVSRFVIGRLAAAGMGAAAGSVVPGAGNAVGFISGLVLGPIVTDAVFDALSEDSVAKDTKAMAENPYYMADPDAALFSPITSSSTAEQPSNSSKIIDFAKFDLPQNWSSLPREDKAKFLERTILQHSPDLSGDSVERLKNIGLGMSDITAPDFSGSLQPKTLFGAEYTPNISTNPEDYLDVEKEDGVERVSPEKTVLEKLLEKLVEIMEGVEENTKKTSDTQSEMFKFNVTRETIMEQIGNINNSIASRAESIKRSS